MIRQVGGMVIVLISLNSESAPIRHHYGGMMIMRENTADGCGAVPIVKRSEIYRW